MTTQPHELESVPLFDAAECAAIREDIFRLRDAWTQRHPLVPFYTLGTASYLDATRDAAAYGRRAQETNPRLREHFGPLYERVAAALSKRFGRPVGYAEEFALPGFHIYLSHPKFCEPVASVHTDEQFKLLDWTPRGGYVPRQHLSVTLPIALPKVGAGLAHWPIRHKDSFKDDEEYQRYRREERRFQPYEVGRMVFHSGHMVHQSILMAEAHPGEDRITLQAHGALTHDGSYLLYW